MKILTSNFKHWLIWSMILPDEMQELFEIKDSKKLSSLLRKMSESIKVSSIEILIAIDEIDKECNRKWH